MSTGSGTYRLDIPPSMGAVYPWFYTILLKPAGLQPTGPPALEDDSYKVEAIFWIKKCGTNAKVKWMGYNSFQNQWIQLPKIIDTASEVVKTFSMGKERESFSLRPKNRI